MSKFTPISKSNEGYDLGAAINSALTGSKITGFTAEVSQELQRKHGGNGIRVPLQAFTTVAKAGVGTTPIYTGAVPLLNWDMHNETQDVDAGIRSELIAGKLGATMVSTNEGEYKMPLCDQRPTASIVDVDAALTTNNGSNFTTKSVKPVVSGSIVRVANSLDFARDPNATRLVAQHVVDGVASSIDAAIFNGYGPTPAGLSWAGLIASATATAVALNNTSTAANWAAVPNAYQLYVQSTRTPEAKWVWHPRVSQLLMVSPPFATATTGLMSPSQVTSNFLNYSAVEALLPTTAAVGGTTDLLFGDFRELFIVMFNGASIELTANPYETNAFAEGSTLLRVMTSFAATLRDPKRILKATATLI